MEIASVALFGEAEKGEYNRGYFCQNVTELMDCLGNPPEDSLGLFYAAQSLFYHHPLIYFRVQDEGFSKENYLEGLKILEKSPFIHSLAAICTPGVGDPSLLNYLIPFCSANHQFLITTERDLFDYLTSPNTLH